MTLICKEILVFSSKIEDTNMDKHGICCQEAHSLAGKTHEKIIVMQCYGGIKIDVFQV